MNIHQTIKALEERVEDLERELAATNKFAQQSRDSMKNRTKSIRAAVIRTLSASSGERWHAGPEFTRGSRLTIPSKPPRLRDRAEIERIPRSDISKIHIMNIFEAQGITNDRRNGIPKSV